MREKQVRRVGRVVRAGVRADEVAAKAAGRVVEEEARREVALGVHGVEQAQPRRIQHGPGAGEQPRTLGGRTARFMNSAHRRRCAGVKSRPSRTVSFSAAISTGRRRRAGTGASHGRM